MSLSRPASQPPTRRRFLGLCLTFAAVSLSACGGAPSAASTAASSSAVSAAASTPAGSSATTTATAVASATTSAAPATSASATSAAATATASSSTAASSLSSAATASSAAPSAAGKTFNYWSWWSPSSNPSFKTWWDFIKPDYASKHPGTSLNVDFVTDDGDYETKFLATVAGGSAPDALHLDIVFAWDVWRHGVLADLSPYVARTPQLAADKFFAGAKYYTQDSGKTFGVATEGPAGYALAYNLDHFQQVGLPTDTATTWAWTWQDFTDAASKLTKRSGDTITQSGWLGASGAVEYFCDWLYSDGGTFYQPDYKSVAFDDGRGAAVLQFLSDMQNKQRVAAPTPKGSSSRQEFWNEKASMVTYGMYLIFDTKQKAPNLHYDLMPFPKGPEGKGPATALEYDMEVIPQGTKDKDLAWEWVSYYAGADVQAALPAKIAFVSPRLDVYDSSSWKDTIKQAPLLDRVPKIAALAGDQAYPFIEMAEVYKELPPIFGQVLQGQLGAAQAVTEAADKVKIILAQANA